VIATVHSDVLYDAGSVRLGPLQTEVDPKREARAMVRLLILAFIIIVGAGIILNL